MNLDVRRSPSRQTVSFCSEVLAVLSPVRGTRIVDQMPERRLTRLSPGIVGGAPPRVMTLFVRRTPNVISLSYQEAGEIWRRG
jgi:hypothetical protein